MAERHHDAGKATYLAALLPWQYFLLSYAAGLLTWLNLPAALCGWLLLLLAGRSLHGVRLAFLSACFALGAVMAVLLAPEPLPVATEWMQRREAAVMEGRVASLERRKENTLRFVLEDLRCTPPGAHEGQPLEGGLLWSWYRVPETAVVPRPGALVRAKMRLRPVHGMANRDLWDYEGWWASKGVRWRAWNSGERGRVEILQQGDGVFWNLRESLRRRVEAVLQPEASQGRAVLFALLFGERGWIDSRTKDLFRDAGVAHSLALSGLHVGMVVLVGVLLARAVGLPAPRLYERLPRQKLGVLCGAGLALVYIWLGGWSPSLLRAGLMFFFWGLLYLMGRSNSLSDGLLLALACILIPAPLLAFDLRLQLSMIAVGGIALLLEVVSLLSRRREDGGAGRVEESVLARAGRWLSMLVLVSLAAQLALLPLVVWNFAQVPLSLWLNLVWLPVLGFVTMPLGLAGMAAAVLPWPEPAGTLFSLAAVPPEGFIGLVGRLQTEGLVPLLYPMRPGWPAWVGYWSVLVLLVLLVRQRKREGRAGLSGHAAAGLALALVLLALPAVRAGLPVLDKGLSLRMLDVGQGQALLLELPRGRRLLLDGGGFPGSDFDLGRAIVSPTLAAHRPPWLEWMVLSHPHGDHSLGLMTPLRRFRVERFASSGRLAGHPLGGEILELARSESRNVVWKAGDRIPLGRRGGPVLEVLHPAPDYKGSENDGSMVLRLVWKGRGLALLPGDVEKDGVEALLASGADLRADVLVLPHHGGWSGLEDALLERVAPFLALASAGYLNRYDFPEPRTVTAVRRHGAGLATTADAGAVTVRWPGASDPPQVETVRAGDLAADRVAAAWRRRGSP